jgi:excisionase family DNA binding protein
MTEKVNAAKAAWGAPVGFVRKEQAAKIMGCSVRTIDHWMAQKLIPYYKFGHRVFLKESDLLAAVEKCKV